MTEELKIKLSVDTAPLRRSINEAKKSVQAINKPSGKGGAAGFKGTNTAAVELKGTLESIRRLQFWELLGKGLEKAKGNLRNMASGFQDFGDHIRNAFSFATGISKFGFTKDMGSAKIEIHEAIDSMKAGFKSLGSAIADFSRSAAAALGIVVAMMVSLVAAFRNAVKVAKQMAIISSEARKIGMSVSSYQKWGYIMKQIGGDAQDLTDFIRTLSSEQVKAREGNEDTIKSFKELGIAAEKLQTMSQQELFEETVRGLAQVEDQVKRTSLAFKIFGEEDAPKLTNLLALNNQQIATMIHNYELLGGYATPELTENSIVLNSSLNNLHIAWQGIKNVLAEAVLPVVISVVKWLVKATAIVRMFLATIFNVDFGKASASTSGATSSMNNYSSAVESATGAIEKLKRSVMGFDELNVLDSPDSGASGSDAGITIPDVGAGFGDLENMFPSPEDLGLDDISAWFNENKTVIEDWATGLTMALGIIMAIAGFATGNIPMGIAGIGLAGLGVAVGMGEGGTWERLFSAIGEGASSLWESVCAGARETKEALVGFFAPAFNWINEKIIQPVAGVISKVSTWVYNDIVQPIVEYGKNVWDMISSIAINIYEEVRDIVVGVIEAVVSIGKKIWEIVSTIIEIAKALGKAFYDYVIKPIVDFVVSCATWIYDKAIKPVINFFVELGKKAYVHIIKPIFDKVIWLKNKVVSIFKTIGNYVVDFIGGSIKGVINGVFAMIENSINFFIGMLNGAVGIINKIPGVNISYIEELSLPRLATGGIATKSTIANIGENGKEAILPLENNTGWMETLANKLAAKQKTPSKIILNLDGRELGWASINNINAITEQTGGIQLVL